MVKFCILSEEVRMSGDIDITAKFQIITKAKLDSIRNGSYKPLWFRPVKEYNIFNNCLKKGACQSVAGNCECDGPEEKDEIHDIVFVIDGSGLVSTGSVPK